MTILMTPSISINMHGLSTILTSMTPSFKNPFLARSETKNTKLSEGVITFYRRRHQETGHKRRRHHFSLFRITLRYSDHFSILATVTGLEKLDEFLLFD